MATWHGVHPAMVLGGIQLVHRAIPEPDGLVFDDERETVTPSPRTALRVGGMLLQRATPSINPDLTRPDSSLDFCPAPVLGEQASGPSEDLAVPVLGSGLPVGKQHHDWRVIAAAHAPKHSEPQRSAEPRRIWNRVYLGLTLAQLRRTDAQTTVVIQNSSSLQPESSHLFPDLARHPVAAMPLQRESAGLPIPHEITLEVTRYMPPAAIHAPLQIGPRSKVGLPSIPQMSIVSD